VVIDAFMFFNELDTLEIRLRELDGVVDQFVLLECAQALSGVKKPFLFELNKQRFSEFLPKIRHVKLGGLPPLKDDSEASRFWLEAFQRNALMQGLVGHEQNPDDLILISDVDEIPSAAAVKHASQAAKQQDIWLFKQRYYKLFFDTEPPAEAKVKPWIGTVGTPYSTFGEVLPNELRLRRALAGRFYDADRHEKLHCKIIDAAGWHLTYFGGEKAYRYKAVNFAHGAKNLHGDAKSTPPASISKDCLSGLKPLDEKLKRDLLEIINGSLSGDIPQSVISNLGEFYQLFRAGFDEKPIPWLRE
jgi:beta-1,4-mannosyl-glycoprotein beta-1,4-N-acetylglucosaminyltransferase